MSLIPYYLDIEGLVVTISCIISELEPPVSRSRENNHKQIDHRTFPLLFPSLSQTIQVRFHKSTFLKSGGGDRVAVCNVSCYNNLQI